MALMTPLPSAPSPARVALKAAIAWSKVYLNRLRGEEDIGKHVNIPMSDKRFKINLPLCNKSDGKRIIPRLTVASVFVLNTRYV